MSEDAPPAHVSAPTVSEPLLPACGVWPEAVKLLRTELLPGLCSKATQWDLCLRAPLWRVYLGGPGWGRPLPGGGLNWPP